MLNSLLMIQNQNNSDGKTIEIKISVKEKKTIQVCNIVFIKAFGKCSLIFMDGGCEIITFHMLKWFEKSLPAPCFFRAHNSILVSCNFIRSYCYKFITLDNEMKIPLSRNRLADLKLNLKNFMETRKNPDQL